MVRCNEADGESKRNKNFRPEMADVFGKDAECLVHWRPPSTLPTVRPDLAMARKIERSVMGSASTAVAEGINVLTCSSMDSLSACVCTKRKACAENRGSSQETGYW